MMTKWGSYFSGAPKYTLWRIDDQIRAKLYKGSPRIDPDYGFYSRFERFLKEEGLDLSFAQMYVTLKSLSDESSQHFDSFKSSFSFPFFFAIETEHRYNLYLLDIYHYRDHFSFSINKWAKAGEYDCSGSYHPFEHEFSREEINSFIRRLYFGLQHEFRHVEKRWDDFFFKGVRSEGLLFGYREGEFFELYLQEEAQYKEAYDLLEERGNSFTASEWAKFQNKAETYISQKADRS